MKSLAAVFVLFIASPAIARAQFGSAVTEGVRIRVTVDDPARQHAMESRKALIHGNVARITGDSLYLQIPHTAGRVGIDRLEIKRLAVSRGMQSPLESAIVRGIGSSIGFAASAWIGWQLTSSADRGNRSAGDAALTGAIYGFAVGAFIGAIWPTEKWKGIPLGK